jgi:hypothetical protein
MSRKVFRSTTLFGLMLLAGAAVAQVDQILPPVGGEGGGQFFARCAWGDILRGFELHTGDDVDAIRPVCAPVYRRDVGGPVHVFSQKFGGDGGGVTNLLCPGEAPAIAGIEIGHEGQDTDIVSTIHLYCSVAVPNQPLTTYPTAAFDGPQIHHTEAGPFTGYDPVFFHTGQQTCPSGLVPVGINGRSGIWLDAVGLICGALHIDSSKAPPPVKSLGRVNSGSPPGPPGPPMTLCERARDARARNSPAAPNLEAQCLASKPPPVKSIGRVKPSSTEPTTPQPARSICAAAADARSRNSPAAPNLEAQCRATGGTPGPDITNSDLEAYLARGEVLAMEDPLAAELRNRMAEGAPRRGFDIGMGVWDGNTAPGPGKQRIHDVLGVIERQGFDVAAAFSLFRNKNAAFATVGATIANADPVVAEARAAEDDVFYWLGFDIAGGIFGDPAAGAQGNTATGPGSLGIRNALNAPAQRGFNAATALHLSRNYR